MTKNNRIIKTRVRIPPVKGKLQFYEWLNKTDARKDYSGQSLFPDLKYYIGVLSAFKYLESRANDLYHTWGKEAHSLDIYIGNTPQHSEASLPVIQLKGIMMIPGQ